MLPIHLLKEVPLFTSLSSDDLQKLSGLVRKKTLSKGEYLFRQGDEGTALYIIMQGRLQVSLSRRLDRVTLAIVGRGECLGEMALLDAQPRSADVLAVEDSEVYALNRQDFLTFLMGNERALRALLYSLSMRLRSTIDLVGDMCFLHLSTRLAKKLVELARETNDGNDSCECTLRISQRELGEILGVSRESINKELKTLRDRKILSTSRNAISILDPEHLKRRAFLNHGLPGAAPAGR